jgi:putative salt-induced outer membrane protein YdiY
VTRLSSVAVVVVCFLCPQFLHAGQIVLKNGDRITGMVVKSDTKEFVIDTDYAGELTVKWDAIDQITSDHPLHVSVKGGQTAVGTIKTEDGKLEIATAKNGLVTVTRDAVEKIRNETEQAAWERVVHPRLWQDWDGGINTSFALTRGNSQTKNLALAFTADRKTLHDHLNLYANSVFATNDTAGVTSTTANAAQGGFRYDRDFDGRLFGFGAVDFQADELQLLNLRSVFSGGLGFHAIKSDTTTLDFLGGLNYTRENYSTFSRNIAALTLGEEFMHKLGKATVLTQKLYGYPDLNEAGQYRAAFNFGTVTKLNKWLGWQNAFGDIYVTNPPAGTRQNDILLTTGLSISFKH